jgi:hypothetical protein
MHMQCGDRNRMRTYPSVIDLSWSSRKMKKKDLNLNLRWCNSVFEMQRWSYLNWFALFNTSFAIYVVLVLPWNLTVVHLNSAFEELIWLFENGLEGKKMCTLKPEAFFVLPWYYLRLTALGFYIHRRLSSVGIMPIKSYFLRSNKLAWYRFYFRFCCQRLN